ncbi:hypothetical protein ACH3XW_1425 [Acanthocheilonema viteae]
METLERVGYSLMVNAAGSNNSDTHGKMFLNIEFRTKNQNGEVKLRNIRISISEFVNFLQQLREMQKGSMQ